MRCTTPSITAVLGPCLVFSLAHAMPPGDRQQKEKPLTGVAAKASGFVAIKGQSASEQVANRAQAQRFLAAVDPELSELPTRSTHVTFTYKAPVDLADDGLGRTNQAYGRTFEVEGVVHDLGPSLRVAQYRIGSLDEAVAFATHQREDSLEKRVVEVRGQDVVVFFGPASEDAELIERVRDQAWTGEAAEAQPDFVSVHRSPTVHGTWLNESALSQPSGSEIVNGWRAEVEEARALEGRNRFHQWSRHDDKYSHTSEDLSARFDGTGDVHREFQDTLLDVSATAHGAVHTLARNPEGESSLLKALDRLSKHGDRGGTGASSLAALPSFRRTPRISAQQREEDWNREQAIDLLRGAMSETERLLNGRDDLTKTYERQTEEFQAEATNPPKLRGILETIKDKLLGSD